MYKEGVTKFITSICNLIMKINLPCSPSAFVFLSSLCCSSEGFLFFVRLQANTKFYPLYFRQHPTVDAEFFHVGETFLKKILFYLIASFGPVLAIVGGPTFRRLLLSSNRYQSKLTALLYLISNGNTIMN